MFIFQSKLVFQAVKYRVIRGFLFDKNVLYIVKYINKSYGGEKPPSSEKNYG